MRVKVVPRPPEDLEALETVRATLPRVPRGETDCCRRLVEGVEWIEDRETASEWLVFSRALGLARRTRAGYARGDVGGYARENSAAESHGINSSQVGKEVRTGVHRRRGADGTIGDSSESRRAIGPAHVTPMDETRSPRETLAARFRAGVLGAAEVVATLGSEPMDAVAVFESVEGIVPEWERRRTGAWQDVWRERTRRLLEWAVLFGLATEQGGGFVAVHRTDSSGDSAGASGDPTDTSGDERREVGSDGDAVQRDSGGGSRGDGDERSSDGEERDVAESSE